MEDFLSNGLLYEKKKIHSYYEDDKKYFDPGHFDDETFEYYCDREGKNTTFQLGLKYGHKSTYPQLDDSVFEGDYLNYTFEAIGTCQSCKKGKVYFLINVSSDKPISDIIYYAESIYLTEKSDTRHDNTSIWAQKVGIYPEFRLKLNKQVDKFFDRESSGYYYKGIKAINDNFGIGALAYFRRIVEKELIHLIETIKELPDANKPMIQNLINEHSKNPTVSTIYTAIFDYLPNSLKILGDNPIKLLYNQTSEGLHSMTESESLHKAENLLRLLEFVIIKIYEEKSTVKDIKDIMKELKSDNKTAP